MLVVLLVGLLAGCAGSGEAAVPEVSVSPSSPPAPVRAPTPTAVLLPTPAPEFFEPTPEGAIAAGTQFVALFDHAYATGDAGPFTAMSTEACEFLRLRAGRGAGDGRRWLREHP